MEETGYIDEVTLEIGAVAGSDRERASIWWARLDELVEAAGDRLGQWISEEDEARAMRYRDRTAADRYRASHVLVNRAIAGFSGTLRAGPAALPAPVAALTTGAHGKPQLISGECQFSLSRSGPYAAVGVSRSRRIGIDIETRADLWTAGEVAPVILTAQELSQLQSLCESARLGAFLDLWCMKEAILKASGEGLGRDPREVCLELAADSVRLLDLPAAYGDPAGWRIGQLSPVAGFPKVSWAMAPTV